MSTGNAITAGGWSHAVSETFVPLHIDGLNDDFRGSLDTKALGRETRITSVSSGISHVSRTKSLARDGHDDVLFLMHRSGDGFVSWDGNRSRLPRGSGSLHTMEMPYELQFDTPSREIVVRLPRHSLSPLHLGMMAPIEVAPDEPAMRLLWAFSKELAQLQDTVPDDLLAAAGETLSTLVISAVLHHDERSIARASGPSAMLPSLKATMRAFAADPDFAVSDAAGRHNISLRYLHKLFEQEAMTPAQYLRSIRLSRARQILADPAQRNLTIATVGFYSGFADVRTFTRAFKSDFGQTPASWRRDT